MRERTTNPKAELNTLQFLRELNQLCDQGKVKTITWLSNKYDLSHNTGWACKKLNIITFEDGIYKWVPKAEPSRKMVLEILEILLERSKKKVDPPAIDGFASQLEKIANTMKDAAHTMVAATKVPSTRMLGRALQQDSMLGNSLFSETENREKKRFEMFDACLQALYSGRPIQELNATTIGQLNDTAVLITEDAINKLYANH